MTEEVKAYIDKQIQIVMRENVDLTIEFNALRFFFIKVLIEKHGYTKTQIIDLMNDYRQIAAQKTLDLAIDQFLQE